MKQQPLLDVDPTARRDADFYATPKWQTHALLQRRPLEGWGGRIVEPCAGNGAIVRQLPPSLDVLTNDIIVRKPLLPEFILDARHLATWTAFRRTGRLDVVVTNPPFNVAIDIAKLAYAHAAIGMALLLRLSWLEPVTEDDGREEADGRGVWLGEHPPTRVIVMPRHDYRGTGKTDSVTSAWMLWAKEPWFCEPGIEVVTKRERRTLIAQYGKAA